MGASAVGRVSVEDLRAIVGAEHAREAGPDDAIDGIVPRFVAEPGSVVEAGAILKLASRARMAVAPRGGGTKPSWGNPPSHLDLILSSARLNRVLEHAAGDLVARVEGGTSLARLQQELARAGQQLALDPPEQGATVGGIIAANASGPKRLRYGTMRDLLIGLTYILPDGTVARAGGRVVKNVAGYDLNKLFTGSLGTLGFVAEAIVRLHPLPAAARLVAVSVDSTEKLAAAVQSIVKSQLVPSALELGQAELLPQIGPSREERQWMLATLFEGIEPGVEAQAQVAADLLQPHGEVRVLGEHKGIELWEHITAPPWTGAGRSEQPGGGNGRAQNAPTNANEMVGLKINHVPARLGQVLEDVLELTRDQGAEARIGGHAGSGVTLTGLSGSGEKGMVRIIQEVRKRVSPDGGSAVVLQAPQSLKELIDVWGPVGDALPLMQQVKARFDPHGIMNPGRFVGGI